MLKPKHKLPKLKPGDLIEVLWHDAWALSGWQDTQAQLNDSNHCEIISIGVFIGWTKAGELLMSSDFNPKYWTNSHGSVRGRPPAMMQKITILKRGRYKVKQ